MHTERCCITYYFSFLILAYFVSLRAFLIVLYFINSLFKRKSVSKFTEVCIKTSKISYFSVSIKLAEKKKMPLKEFGLERGVRKKF